MTKLWVKLVMLLIDTSIGISVFHDPSDPVRQQPDVLIAN